MVDRSQGTAPVTAPREMTRDEVREAFTAHVRSAIRQWATCELRAIDIPPGVDPTLWRVEGVAHTILAAIDGSVGNLPGFVLAPRVRPEDVEFWRSKGRNWWPDGRSDPDAFDIGGGLRYATNTRAPHPAG